MSGAWPPTLAGFTLEHYQEIASTQDRARALARAGQAPAVVVADVQTRGRGRLGRGWVSPEGNLYASIVLRRTFDPALAPAFSLVVAVTLADVVERLGAAPSRLTLKWPNDPLLDERKLAGILLEADGAHLLVGMGVNVETAPADAASLAAAGLPVSRCHLLEAVLRGLDAAGRELEENGFATIRRAWLARAAWIGQPIRVVLADGVLMGRHGGIDGQGALLVETEDGIRTVHAGDVERVRLEETS